MSVPKYRQNLSSTEYTWRVYKLAVRIGEIIANKPKKYKGTYSDKMIRLSLDALSAVTQANEIFVKTRLDYEVRRSHLLKARGDLWSLLTISDIFLEQCKKSPNADKEKLTRDQDEIGDAIDEATKLVNGVIESDNRRYKSI